MANLVQGDFGYRQIPDGKIPSRDGFYQLVNTQGSALPLADLIERTVASNFYRLALN
jgi:hypothetical protein